MKDKIIKSKAVITADMLSSADTTIDELLSKAVCEAQIEEMAKDLKTCLPNNWYWQKTVDTDTYFVAKHFYNEGYRKVNKDECEYWKSRCKEIGDVAYEKARKETAKEILEDVMFCIDINCCNRNEMLILNLCEMLAKQFGVEAE